MFGAALLGLFSSVSTHAGQMFVIDKVILNVFAEPRQDSGKVASLESGDLVEVMEAQDSYAHVRLPDGREGWTRASYLTEKPPAIVRLRELQSTQSGAIPELSAGLAKQVADLQKQNAVLSDELSQAKESAAAATKIAAAEKEKLSAALPTQAERVDASRLVAFESASTRDKAPIVQLWSWFAAVLVAGALGFLLGYQTLATRIKRKYGSIRIY